ncbi:zinc-binding dehydrogenase [Variovorax paradoxus]|nr:zinc-binding dehydrogenase [Variovorax paradoxus]
MGKQMISFWIRKHEADTVLERREEPMPNIEGNKMLVRMRAASLNRGDIMARIARHSADQPRPAGADGAGEVIDPGRSGFAAGDRVLFRAHGCFAEFAAVDPALAALMPEGMGFEQGAAIPGAFVTAWEGLIQYGEASPGDWVLLCGASSGVGVAALQLAKHMGARVIATSTSARKLSVLSVLGADEVIEARGSAFSEDVLRITQGRGVNVALNLVGGTAFPGCVRVAADFGRVVMIGYVDGELRAECDLEAVHGRRLRITGISNAPLKPEQRAMAHVGFMRDAFPALASGAIQPVIDKVFSFEDLVRAKEYVESNQQLGKVIVRIP